MGTSGLTLQTIDVKSSLAVDSISLCFSQLFHGIKYFDFILLLGLTVIQQLIFFPSYCQISQVMKKIICIKFVFMSLYSTQRSI